MVSCYKPSRSISNFFKFILKANTRGVPNRSIIFQDWAHQSFICCLFYLLWTSVKIRLRKPRVRLALVQILLTCVFHRKSFVIVTPRYLMFSTFSRTVPSRVYGSFFIRFLVICIIIHLTVEISYLISLPSISIDLYLSEVSMCPLYP